VIRVAICGGDELPAACMLLALEHVGASPGLVLVALRIPDAAARAAAFAEEIPRIVVATPQQADCLAALGSDRAFIAPSADPAVIGPLIARAVPEPTAERTRVVTLTAARGGVGRTMCTAGLARRLARGRSVVAIDATGTGALGWWLNADPRPWSELESVAGELRSEHIELVAATVAPRLSLVGGSPTAPSSDVLEMAVAAAREVAELVLVDAPLLSDERARRAVATSDRVLVLSYADPASRAALAASDVPATAWIIASQDRIDDAFRILPRDERAAAEALAGRAPIGGALGRAYEELADLLAIDAS